MSTAIAPTAPETALAERSPAENPAAVYLARLAPGSRRTMRQALDTIAGLLTTGQLDATTAPWAALRYEHTQAVRAALRERYAPATANKMLSALRGVLREAWRLGQTDAESYRRAADLAAVKGSRLPAGRALDAGELTALFAACAVDTSPAGARDAALLALLYGGGLRRSEAVALELTDYDPQSCELRVRGKGDKERTAHATNGGKAALDLWLDKRGDAPGALLNPVNKGGKVANRPMTDQAAFGALRKRAKQAGVASFSPHDLRRSFISDLLDAGADISTVQQLAGHANVTTTQRYDRRGEKVKRKAAELIHVPFSGPGRRSQPGSLSPERDPAPTS